MSIADYLTFDEPLGPTRHEVILRRSASPHYDSEPLNSLLSQSRTFDTNLESVRPIVVGRRGSGKTAFVMALLSEAQNQPYYYELKSETNPAPSSDRNTIVVLIQSYDHLDELVNRVGADCLHSLGEYPDWEQLHAETAARHWARHIWHVIFQQIYSDSFNDTAERDYRSDLPLVFQYIEGDDIAYPRSVVTDDALNEVFEETKLSVEAYFTKHNIRCNVVIDSIDTYPVHTTRFANILAGFLRFLSSAKDDNPNVRVFCCLPEELSPFIREHSANEERDFSDSGTISRLVWSPHDLLRIVAERYRLFYHFNIKDDRKFLKEIENLDFSQSKNLQKLFGKIIPSEIKNKNGITENTLSYIIRHTQLLPRQVLTIFSQAIVISHEENGSWRNIQGSAIRESIEKSESMLARNTLKPFRPMYRDLIDAAADIVPSLPPICSLSDLDKIERRFPSAVRDRHPRIWGRLFEMGIIGYIDEERSDASDVYESAYFHYNTERDITFAKHIRYCVHPIFSGSWNLGRNKEMKFVYPAKIDISL